MSEQGPKTPDELGISESDWIDLAESLIISRAFIRQITQGDLSAYHRLRVQYLEEYFGITKPIDTNNNEVID